MNKLLEGENLCKKCGLCCQGVFHPTALLYTSHDINLIQETKISVEFDKEENSSVFILPCPAFNSLCAIYPERPSVCSGHKCDLLRAMIDRKTTLKDALVAVEKMKKVVSGLLPELKKLSKNNKSNYPRHLIQTIYDNLEGEQSREEFNYTYKKLLMIIGTFRLLEERYFYKDSNRKF